MRRLFLATIPLVVATPIFATPVVLDLSLRSAIESGVTNISDEISPENAAPKREAPPSDDERRSDERKPGAPLSKEELCETIVSSAQANQLPVRFFTHLIWQESGFDPRSVSHAGARGIAQFMPQVAREIGLNDPYDPLQALPASARLLQSLFQKFGNLGLAAAAYNAGPKRVFDWLANRVRLPKETQHYVLTITGHPAESWQDRDAAHAIAQVPKAVPCHGVDLFAAAEEAEASAMADDAEASQAAPAAQTDAVAMPPARSARPARLAHVALSARTHRRAQSAASVASSRKRLAHRTEKGTQRT